MFKCEGSQDQSPASVCIWRSVCGSAIKVWLWGQIWKPFFVIMIIQTFAIAAYQLYSTGERNLRCLDRNHTRNHSHCNSSHARVYKITAGMASVSRSALGGIADWLPRLMTWRTRWASGIDAEQEMHTTTETSCAKVAYVRVSCVAAVWKFILYQCVDSHHSVEGR